LKPEVQVVEQSLVALSPNYKGSVQIN